MGIFWDDDAWDDYLYWQTQDKKTLKRINALVKEIERTPYEGIVNLVTSIRYIALSHSVWSVLQPAIPVIILALAAIAFCKNNYKVALAAGIVATIYFLLPASHMSTEPVVIQLCDIICLDLYTLKLCVQDNYEETGYDE